MNNKARTRQSNFELLRIIAMLTIIANHFAVHSDFSIDTFSISINSVWIHELTILGNAGVNIFVLISGFFLIDSSSLKVDKVLKQWLQIFTYSILLYIGYCLASLESFSKGSLVEHLMPISSSQWWFASAYFILYMLSPYLAMMLKSLNKEHYHNLIITMTVMWCVFPTFLGISLQANALLWFINVFAIAGYIKLYDPLSDWSSQKVFITTGAIIALSLLLVIAFDVVGTKISWFGSHSTYLFGLQMLPTLVIACLTFISFKRINIKFSKVINTISSTTFGIYLLHDYSYSRDYIWKDLLNNAAYQYNRLLIPYSLIIIVAVFTVGMIVELLRINILEKLYMKLISKING